MQQNSSYPSMSQSMGIGGAFGALPGLASAFTPKNTLFGSPSRFERLPTMNNQQMNLMQSLGQAVQPGLDYYQGILGGDQSQLGMLSAPIMRQFERQIAPGLAGRFAAGNSMRGSAFQNALGQAGVDLGTNLGSLQANLLGQAAGNLTGMSGQALLPTFQNIFRPQTPGLMDYLAQMLGGAGSGFGQGMGAMASKSIMGM